MKQIHLQILRMLPGPFFGWLTTLMFLLVMQFLIRYLPDLVGRGLPPGVILEIVAYNLAYMVVLAVPMSVLISTLMTFGKLAEANVYTVLKSAGVSLIQIAWPALLAAVFVSLVMVKFNSEMLPAANYRASSLWKDIRKKKPGFELTSGIFYDGISDYSILVQELPPETNEMIDVTIFDTSTNKREQIVIKAARGELHTEADGVSVKLRLFDGEIHRILPPRNRNAEIRYERLAFGEHTLSIDLSELSFERSETGNGYRSDRTMPTQLMVKYVDSLETSIGEQHASLLAGGMRWLQDSTYVPFKDSRILAIDVADTASAYPTNRVALASLTQQQQQRVYENALNLLRASRTTVDNTKRSVEWEIERADRYRVEIHKKFSIAVACIIFTLIGIPLGLSMRRGGLGAVGGMALAIFLFYWVTLVQGEKLADRGMLIPWVGMWGANLVMLIIGLLLLLFVLFDLRARPIFRKGPPPS